MRVFLESEKVHQAQFKHHSPLFSAAARADGPYRRHSYPFCLPRGHSIENIFPPIRKDLQGYFTRHAIKWHDAQDGYPSPHMCDSQVCCVNFLFSLGQYPQALKALLSPLIPDFAEAIPIEDGKHVAFEWIGETNYLHERLPRGGKRTRGANFTSADAAVLYRTYEGSKAAVIIEWKYTEAYPATNIRFAKSGTDRLAIYRDALDKEGSPIVNVVPGGYPALFFEPFYQLMRQQLLAYEMEKARELGATRVTLLHICPRHNVDFLSITSPSLRSLGTKPTDVWRRLLRTPDRFIAANTEPLFQSLDLPAIPELSNWWSYITGRYPWVLQ